MNIATTLLGPVHDGLEISAYSKNNTFGFFIVDLVYSVEEDGSADWYLEYTS